MVECQHCGIQLSDDNYDQCDCPVCNVGVFRKKGSQLGPLECDYCQHRANTAYKNPGDPCVVTKCPGIYRTPSTSSGRTPRITQPLHPVSSANNQKSSGAGATPSGGGSSKKKPGSEEEFWGKSLNSPREGYCYCGGEVKRVRWFMSERVYCTKCGEEKKK